MIWAAVLGFLGSHFPAIRAARFTRRIAVTGGYFE